jgi:hypothetical protein
LKISPASPSFVSHRTGTGNNENPIAKQESNEIRRMELVWEPPNYSISAD